MQSKCITIDNFVFLLSAFIAAAICFFLLTANDASSAVLGALFTYSIYSSKPQNGNYAYTLLWAFIVLSGCYIGIWLKLSVGFYLFLFAISSYYYITYGKDSFSDRAVPSMIIYAALGTTTDPSGYPSVFAYLIGSVIAVLLLGMVHKNKIEFSAFGEGLFSKSFYSNSSYLWPDTLVYSGFLFLSLYLPYLSGIDRPFWSLMTFVFLVKPKDGNLLKDTLTRFWGNFVAAVIVVLTLRLATNYDLIKWMMLALSIFLLPSFYKMGNFYTSFGMSLFFLLLIEVSTYWNEPSYALPDTRILETVIGGVLALVASFVLKWMRKNYSKNIA